MVVVRLDNQLVGLAVFADELDGLVRMLDDEDRLVVLEEALPALGDIPRYGDRGSRVTEYIFGLSATEDSGEWGGRRPDATAAVPPPRER